MSTAPPPRALPAGLPRALVVLIGLAAGVVLIGGMKASASIFGPVMLALVITIAVHPLRRLLDRRLPSWVSTTICLVVTVGLLVALVLSLVVATARFATLLPDYQSDFKELVDNISAPLSKAGVSSENVHTITSSLDLSRLTDFVVGAVSGVVGVLSDLFFLITLMLFMAVDGGAFPTQLGRAAELHPGLVAALTDFAHSTRRYLVVATAFGLVVAVLDTLALVILGVPAAALWGLLAFLTNYIPNIGFVIGLVPPAILALLEGGPGLMLSVIAVYCVLNVVIQTLIQPRVVGDSVGLSTTLTFLSLVFWAWILGPLGAVLAIPLSLLVKAVLVDADPASQWLAPLVANRATEPD